MFLSKFINILIKLTLHLKKAFPAGFLQQPFIGMGLKAIDYGALGSVGNLFQSLKFKLKV